MDFTYKELALLNMMITIALMSGKIEFDEVLNRYIRKLQMKL